MIDYTKIKQDIADALDGAIDGITEISIDKIFPQQFEDLPAIAIYAIGGSSVPLTHTIPPAFSTDLSIVIDVIVSENDTYVQTLTTIVERIQQRLFSETMQDWYIDNDFTQFQSKDFSIIPNKEGSRETVTGELTLLLNICESYA